MAIQHGVVSNPDFPLGKSHYVKTFAIIVVENSPELEHVFLYNIPHQLGFSKDDENRFLHIQNEIRNWLSEKNLIKQTGFIPIELVIDAKQKLTDYLERERIKREKIQNPNAQQQTPNQKYAKFKSVGFWASIVTIISFFIVLAYLIPETTPYIGMKWWGDFLNL